ncbi:DUF4949 domain-containing protein [Legionella sp. km772]|uniref:DUF4949 domain-containing protein n=1 Tax=Legionella sp. km772 TaxID=2498111 RepID=UPI000F8E442A|nr:DUF4949 domain-containing protein [Legionella sp. km772]RUR06178.1 DUF4949 domain-containing protein [Legionella sp. km772]
MMFSKLTTAVSALLLAGSVYAGQVQLCPDINDIKMEGMSMAEPIMNNLFFSYNLSNYNTSTNWGFVIAPIEADSEEMAIDRANEVLDGMSSPGIPEEADDELVCVYNTGRQDILAAAINADHMISPSKLKQYIQKRR